MADAAIAQTTISVAVIDLDHFKAWNDEHGHAAGDALLRDAATAWKCEFARATCSPESAGMSSWSRCPAATPTMPSRS